MTSREKTLLIASILGVLLLGWAFYTDSTTSNTSVDTQQRTIQKVINVASPVVKTVDKTEQSITTELFNALVPLASKQNAKDIYDHTATLKIAELEEKKASIDAKSAEHRLKIAQSEYALENIGKQNIGKQSPLTKNDQPHLNGIYELGKKVSRKKIAPLNQDNEPTGIDLTLFDLRGITKSFISPEYIARLNYAGKTYEVTGKKILFGVVNVRVFKRRVELSHLTDKQQKVIIHP